MDRDTGMENGPITLSARHRINDFEATGWVGNLNGRWAEARFQRDAIAHGLEPLLTYRDGYGDFEVGGLIVEIKAISSRTKRQLIHPTRIDWLAVWIIWQERWCLVPVGRLHGMKRPGWPTYKQVGLFGEEAWNALSRDVS